MTTGANHDEIEAAAGAAGLDVMGAFHAEPGDGLPDATGTLVLLGPRQPGFWDLVTRAPEFADGRADPLDRWSARVIGDLAEAFGGQAVFPFGGPPHAPFQRWAMRSGRAWISPVTLQVHERAGLWLSFRGALALPQRLALPAAPERAPCGPCARPCLGACPAGALTGDGYDVAACRAFLDTGPGAECMALGCAVRRACPVAGQFVPAPAQAAFHMRQFHP